MDWQTNITVVVLSVKGWHRRAVAIVIIIVVAIDVRSFAVVVDDILLIWHHTNQSSHVWI